MGVEAGFAGPVFSGARQSRISSRARYCVPLEMSEALARNSVPYEGARPPGLDGLAGQIFQRGDLCFT
jgi:hypothetical protein